MGKETEILKLQQYLNNKLAQLFKENGIKNFRLTSFGNSIASGYSFVRTTKPLLKRNETLEKTMEESQINLDVHHFARAQNNNDEHLFEWLVTNIKESEIHKLNRNDYSGGPTSMTTHGLTKEELEKYYPLMMEHDIRLQDAIFESGEDMANIVVYNGCTGSFLDNATRQGKIHEILTYGINRDTRALEATLKVIQSNNRIKNSNTQVYICGAPNLLGLKITEIINMKLKKIAKKYANVVYVEPVKSKLLYKNVDANEKMDLSDIQSIFKKYLLLPDVHYDEEEYIKLNNNIIESISENYLVTQAMIEIDRSFYTLSSNLELENQELIKDCDYIQQVITNLIITSASRLKDEEQRQNFFNKAKNYLISRTPYDFHFLGKRNIQEVLNEQQNAKKK